MEGIVMSRDRIEKLGTLFLAVFTTALTAQLVSTGMFEAPIQWLGAVIAVLGSITIAVLVRIWPQPERAKVRED
jgi:uncharacterized membrane protein YccC